MWVPHHHSAEMDNTNARYQSRVALATLKYEEVTNPQLALLLHSLAEKVAGAE
jgi:hypothetical protein